MILCLINLQYPFHWHDLNSSTYINLLPYWAWTCLWLSLDQLEAVSMHQTIEKLQRKLCHPFSISLMQTREKVLKVDYLAFMFFYVSFIFKGEIHLRPNGFIIGFLTRTNFLFSYKAISLLWHQIFLIKYFQPFRL